MEQLRILVETIKPIKGGHLSAWFTLPIDKAEFEETLGVEVDSENYRIIEKELPFATEVTDSATVDMLNELYTMYEALPPAVQAEIKEFLTMYHSLEELYQHRYDIIHYADACSMIDIARIVSKDDPLFQMLTEQAEKYFDYEAYSESLQQNGTYLETAHGIFKLT